MRHEKSFSRLRRKKKTFCCIHVPLIVYKLIEFFNGDNFMQLRKKREYFNCAKYEQILKIKITNSQHENVNI